MKALLEAVETEERRQNRRLLVLLRAAQADKQGFDRIFKAMG